MSMLPMALIQLVLLFQLSKSSSSLSFDDYPALRTLRGPAVRPQFAAGNDVWPDSNPKFQRSVNIAVSRGANFAGSATLVQTSCGTGCEYISVVDNETGAVYTDMPFFALLMGPFQDDQGRKQDGGLEFRKTSRLLIATGCFDSTLDSRHGYYAKLFYIWTGHKFRLLKRINLDWH